MIKVKNEKHLLEILNLFSKNGLKENHSDLAQKNYKKNLKNEEELFGKIVKEDEEDDDMQEENEELDDEDSTDADSNNKDKNNYDDQKVKEEEHIQFGKSLEDILSALNLVRAGKSTKNKEIKGEIQNYYDRLDENERKILHIFLKELSSILLGAISGDKAIDPSEPPFSFDVISTKSKEKDSQKDSMPQQKIDKKQTTDTSSNNNNIEDTSPPIKVNESQDINEIKRRIKKLMIGRK